MRIALVGNGKSAIVRSWADFLKREHEVFLITDEPRPLEGIKVIPIGSGSKKNSPLINFPRKVIQTRRILKDLQPDVTHAHYLHGYGLLVALSNQHPFIGTAMGNDIGSSSMRSWTVRTGSKYVLRKADVITVKDTFAKERAVELGGDASRIEIVHSICNLGEFNPGARSDSLRRELEIVDRPSVIFTRPFGQNYQSDVLVKAIPHVVKEIPNVVFILARRSDWKSTRDFLVSEGCKDNVNFVPFIPHDQMANYLASVDIYVDTYYPEFDVGGHGHGTNTIEAMACGCALILPDRKEYTEDWCNAELYRRGDSLALAEAIIDLLEDTDRRILMGKQGYEIAREFGDQEVMLERVLEIFRSLI